MEEAREVFEIQTKYSSIYVHLHTDTLLQKISQAVFPIKIP